MLFLMPAETRLVGWRRLMAGWAAAAEVACDGGVFAVDRGCGGAVERVGRRECVRGRWTANQRGQWNPDHRVVLQTLVTCRLPAACDRSPLVAGAEIEQRSARKITPGEFVFDGAASRPSYEDDGLERPSYEDDGLRETTLRMRRPGKTVLRMRRGRFLWTKRHPPDVR
jgi:hypothetical protein